MHPPQTTLDLSVLTGDDSELREEHVYGDAGYTGADKRTELKEREVTWRIAMKRGKLKAMAEGPLKELTIRAEHLKAKLRARVEHPFHVVKNRFGHRKVRYKGLRKKTPVSSMCCSPWPIW